MVIFYSFLIIVFRHFKRVHTHAFTAVKLLKNWEIDMWQDWLWNHMAFISFPVMFGVILSGKECSVDLTYL